MPRPTKSAKHEPPETKAMVTVDYGPSPEEPPAGTYITPTPVNASCQYILSIHLVQPVYRLYKCIFTKSTLLLLHNSITTNTINNNHLPMAFACLSTDDDPASIAKISVKFPWGKAVARRFRKNDKVKPFPR